MLIVAQLLLSFAGDTPIDQMKVALLKQRYDTKIRQKILLNHRPTNKNSDDHPIENDYLENQEIEKVVLELFANALPIPEDDGSWDPDKFAHPEFLQFEIKFFQ